MLFMMKVGREADWNNNNSTDLGCSSSATGEMPVHQRGQWFHENIA